MASPWVMKCHHPLRALQGQHWFAVCMYAAPVVNTVIGLNGPVISTRSEKSVRRVCKYYTDVSLRSIWHGYFNTFGPWACRKAFHSEWQGLLNGFTPWKGSLIQPNGIALGYEVLTTLCALQGQDWFAVCMYAAHVVNTVIGLNGPVIPTRSEESVRRVCKYYTNISLRSIWHCYFNTFGPWACRRAFHSEWQMLLNVFTPWKGSLIQPNGNALGYEVPPHCAPYRGNIDLQCVCMPPL